MYSLEKADITPNTKVFVRADLDVPIENGTVLDTFRLDHLLPTLTYLKQKKAKILIAGHLDRPEGVYISDLSTRHLLPYFKDKLGKETFELLENLRFDSREEKNEDSFARELADKADMYVNECFATSHRKHASFVKIPKYIPSYAGFRLMEEVSHLSGVLKNPKRPLVALVGGVKIETKGPAISRFLEVCDYVLVGGKLISSLTKESNQKLILASGLTQDGLDIDSKSANAFSEIIKKAESVVWSGPMGMYEQGHIEGTRAVAKAIISSKAFSVIGGGDTIAAVKKLGLLDQFSFVSTGGGSMLEFLVKGTLPGLEALGYYG